MRTRTETAKQLPGYKPLTPTKEQIRAEELYEHPRCRHCGRKLHSIKSIRRGFGSTCGLVFGERWVRAHPSYLSPRAKQKWSKPEIRGLIFAVKRDLIKKQLTPTRNGAK